MLARPIDVLDDGKPGVLEKARKKDVSNEVETHSQVDVISIPS